MGKDTGGNMKAKILKVMAERGIDGYFITKYENVRYLTGYTARDASLFLTADKMLLITEPRSREQVEKECPEVQIVDRREYGRLSEVVQALVKQERITKMAIEKKVVSLNLFNSLKEDITIPIEGLDDVLEEMRSIKTPEEIHNLRCACNLACKAFDLLLNDIRVGVTEKELESKLSYYMVALGGDTKPNFNLLISGARTSLLHGMPSAKSIEYGDLILMDFGIEYRGYTSDMTRVVVAGKAKQEYKELYATVNQMLDNCIDVLRDGVKAKDVCAASYGTIKGTKYEPHYYPSIGHGVGLFVHEIPFLRPTSEDILHENNVIAVEPAIFIPGWGGIHLEDNILITKDGCENFTTTEKRLIEL